MVASNLQLSGRVYLEHLRDGVVIGRYHFPNGITNQGKNALLDIMFHGTTQITSWRIGLIDATGATLAATDTYAGINDANGWDEFDDYDEATRPEWTEGAAASQSITNSTAVTFTLNAAGTIHGLFVVGGGTAASTKNDNAGGGTLWATAPFTTPKPVESGDQFKVTYAVNG